MAFGSRGPARSPAVAKHNRLLTGQGQGKENKMRLRRNRKRRKCETMDGRVTRLEPDFVGR